MQRESVYLRKVSRLLDTAAGQVEVVLKRCAAQAICMRRMAVRNWLALEPLAEARVSSLIATAAGLESSKGGCGDMVALC